MGGDECLLDIVGAVRGRLHAQVLLGLLIPLIDVRGGQRMVDYDTIDRLCELLLVQALWMVGLVIGFEVTRVARRR